MFKGLMFLEGYVANVHALDAIEPEWRRKPWLESWEEAARHEAAAAEAEARIEGASRPELQLDACACG